jgi:hypothetical protein
MNRCEEAETYSIFCNVVYWILIKQQTFGGLAIIAGFHRL